MDRDNPNLSNVRMNDIAERLGVEYRLPTHGGTIMGQWTEMTTQILDALATQATAGVKITNR